MESSGKLALGAILGAIAVAITIFAFATGVQSIPALIAIFFPKPTPSPPSVAHASRDLLTLIESCVRQRESADCDVARVRAFLRNGANPNTRSTGGSPVLHLALGTGLSIEVVDALLDAGALVNAPDSHGTTPLMLPVQHYYPPSGRDTVRLLIAAGADVNAKQSDGTTALMLAARRGWDDEVVRQLLEAGAFVNQANSSGETALSIARKQVKSGGAPKTHEILRLLEKAADAEAARSMQAPVVLRNICPAEGCQFGSEMARARIAAFEREGDTSHQLFSIQPEEAYRSITGNIHVLRPGIVEVRRSVQAMCYSETEFDTCKGRVINPGDRIYLLVQLGEGRAIVWHEGKILNIDQFWETPMERPEYAADDSAVPQTADAGVLRSSPISTWWILVENGRRERGWIRSSL